MLTMKLLALKYHPDRNPGKEVEFNAKFQAIQSANEVLTDPQQRAKYDLQRMRAGLSTYTGASPPPPRPNVPTRNPASNFPPPPRPPPPSYSKSNFPPPPSGPQKYARFNRAEPAAPWPNSSADDAKSKTGDYKAWEQMRHGRGPIPSTRTVPPKVPRANTFQPGRDMNGVIHNDPPPRGARWDNLRDTQAGMPGGSRSNTTRTSPRRTGFTPSPASGDEPQARSAYFNASSGQRQANSRNQTHMAPPPFPGPTSKKPDPLQAFRERAGFNANNEPRVSTPYHTSGGEKTFTSPGLQRSSTSATSTPRDSNSRTGWYDKSANADGAHQRAASANSNNHSMSPSGKKDAGLPGMYSSSESSSSSSDEGEPPYASARPRPTQVPKSRRTRAPAGGHRQNTFNPYARIEDVDCEPMAPQAGLRSPTDNGLRRHSATDMKSPKASEGFSEHPMNHDPDRSQQQAKSAPTAFESPTRPVQRSKSWHQHYGSPPQDKNMRPATGEQQDRAPMYEQGYTPFSTPLSSGPPSSDKWSDQWPFKSPKKPRTASAEPPPYWAIPSCLPPPKMTVSHKGLNTQFPLHAAPQNPSIVFADDDPFDSFTIPDEARKAHASTPPLRSQSSETIHTKFAAPGWDGRFRAESKPKSDSVDPPSLDRANTPSSGASPTKGNVFQQQEDAQQSSASGRDMEGKAPMSINVPFPRPPSSEGKYTYPNLNDVTFDISHENQARSPSRTTTRKRPRRQFSFNNTKRTVGGKPVNVQATVDDAGEEPNAGGATGESLESLESSQASSDVDAMEVDDPIPASSAVNVNEQQKKGRTIPSTQTGGGDSTPRQGPTLPPRANIHPQLQSDDRYLQMGDLKNVAPFAPSNEGLNGMKDMASTLPFESRASPRKPVNGPQTLPSLPNPPACPSTPLNLTRTSWERYVEHLRIYVEKWNIFNNKMVNAVCARQNAFQEGLNRDWMSVGSGYELYMKGLEEDRKARVHWDVACEHHEKCMKALGDVREEICRGRGDIAATF